MKELKDVDWQLFGMELKLPVEPVDKEANWQSGMIREWLKTEGATW